MNLGIAVVGLGRWGPNYVRIFSNMDGCHLAMVVDSDVEKCNKIMNKYPDVRSSQNASDILSASDVDAVVVATPSETHYDLVSSFLKAGKHVLCEKPLTTKSEDAWSLVDLANNGPVLMTGHVFLFSPGIKTLIESTKEAMANGNLYYVNAVRTNMGPFRKDVNAAWDLASHDIYIFNHLIGEAPEAVSAVGGSYLRKPVEDIVFITARYPSGVIGHMHISWLDPKKVRQITAVTETKMITWDEAGTPGPVMVYDRSVVQQETYGSFGEFQLLAREGDVVVPKVKAREPLTDQATEFVRRCSGEKADTRGTPEDGARVVDVLQAVDLSLAREGQMVQVQYGK